MLLCHRVPRVHIAVFADKNGFSYVPSSYLVGSIETARSALPPPVAVGISWQPRFMQVDAQIAKDFGNSLVLCPAIPNDGAATSFLFDTFLDHVHGIWGDEKPKLVAVPQGKNIEEFETCFFRMLAKEDRLYGYGLTVGTLTAMGSFYTGSKDAYPNRLTYYKKRLAQYITRSSKAVILLETGNATAHELSDFHAGSFGESFCISSAAFSAALASRDLRKEGADHKECDRTFDDTWNGEQGPDTLALAGANMDYLNEFVK